MDVAGSTKHFKTKQPMSIGHESAIPLAVILPFPFKGCWLVFYEHPFIEVKPRYLIGSFMISVSSASEHYTSFKENPKYTISDLPQLIWRHETSTNMSNNTNRR